MDKTVFEGNCSHPFYCKTLDTYVRWWTGIWASDMGLSALVGTHPFIHLVCGPCWMTVHWRGDCPTLWRILRWCTFWVPTVWGACQFQGSHMKLILGCCQRGCFFEPSIFQNSDTTVHFFSVLMMILKCSRCVEMDHHIYGAMCMCITVQRSPPWLLTMHSMAVFMLASRYTISAVWCFSTWLCLQTPFL